MPDLFKEILPSIMVTGKSVIKDDIDLKDYKPYHINKALSYHNDCLAAANQMNLNHHLDKDMQYQYLLNTIRHKKRSFKSGQKSEVDKNIECVKEYYKFSNSKAKEALRVLSDKQIAEIKRKTDKGGVKKS